MLGFSSTKKIRPNNASFFSVKKAASKSSYSLSKNNSYLANQSSVRGILATVQTKLNIGKSSDEFEHEADRVAAQVLESSENDGEIKNTLNARSSDGLSSHKLDQRSSTSLKQGNIKTLSPISSTGRRSNAVAGAAAPSESSSKQTLSETDHQSPTEADLDYLQALEKRESMEYRLTNLFTQGQAIPDDIRSEMESAFGEDFSTVKIHTGEQAAQLSHELNAHAFTAGDHIAFGRGAWAPENRRGKKLLAHELTHVVQQRGGSGASSNQSQAEQAAGATKNIQRVYIPGVSEAAEFVGDTMDSAGEFIADQGWRLVRRYAPRLVPILQRGPLNWLKDQISSAFDSIVETLNRLNIGPVVEQLLSAFGGLMDRASTIIQALISGDCRPLFAAISQLKAFVTEVAGQAWDKLTEFLSPVGDFFSDLWDSIGAPALQWLQNFAGDLWDSVQQLGTDIWNWTQPVRDALSAAWDWVKEQLFGNDDDSSGNDEGGIIGWITTKAGEAWDWVKERTRPVWEPIQQGLAWLREIIPPAFVRNMGESMTELSQNLGQAEQQMGDEGEPGADVAENREAIAAAMPSLQAVLNGVRQIIVNAKNWLWEKVGGLRDKVLTFFTRLRSNTITSRIANMLSWLESGVLSLGDWVQQKVWGLFDWLVTGFDYLRPFVEKIIGIVQKVIAVAADILQLPQMILSSLWNLIPECIRNPIKDFVVNQILARIPVFGQLVRVADLWQRVQATALRIIRQVFVDGNIAGAAWTFFQSMLRLIGLPPELVVQVLAKAAGAIGHILTDPFGFITNSLRAIWRGFSQFFTNIGQHLMSGVAGWLFGNMREGGIEPPQDLSLRSLLGVVLQVLDITVERIFRRLERRIGAENVARLRRMLSVATGVWNFVRILVEEGPGGLWRELQERLSSLGSQLLNSVISWVTTTIVTRVSARLLTMLDPSGIMAVVNGIIAFYRAIQSFIQHLREMLEIANSVLDGINGIATGAIGIAANFLEGALSRAIPVAIGFLANQVGLGNFGSRIREMVTGVRAGVDSAIDWVIDRAIRLGQGILNLVRQGAAAVAGVVRRGVAAVRNWWSARKQFRTQNGEQHSVYIHGRGSNARVMLASTPQTYESFLNSVNVPANRQSDKDEAVRIARELDQAIATAATAENRQSTNGQARNDTVATDHAANIDGILERLSNVTARFMPSSGPGTPPIYGSLIHGFGSSVSVERLRSPSYGSGPSVGDGHWEALRRRKDGGSSYYVRGHLLNDNLGGPGNTWDNLTPLTQGANNRHANSMLHQFETPVKRAVLDNKKTVNFVVTANYGFTHPLIGETNYLESTGNDDDLTIANIIRAEQYVPRSLNCRAHEVDDNGARVQNGFAKEFPVDNTFATNSTDDYHLTATPKSKFYIDDKASAGDTSALSTLNGVDAAKAQAIVDNRPSNGYRSGVTLRRLNSISDSQWNQMRGTSAYHVRIYRRGS